VNPLESMKCAVVALDSRGDVTRINGAGAALLGRPADEIVGTNWFDAYIPADVREEVREVHASLLAGQTVITHFENQIIDAAGHKRQVSWQNMLLRAADGTVVGSLSTGVDVGIDASPAASSRRSAGKLEDLHYALDQTAIIAETDQRGVIHYVNRRFCEISGYEADELIGRDHRVVNSGYHPQAFFREMWTTISAGQVWRGEIRNRRKQSGYYWVETTIIPYVDERGKPERYLAIRYDITDQKKAETEIRERQALTQLGQMAAVVAHEVRNPLAGMAGALQIIGNRLPDSSPDREVIGSILERIGLLDVKVEELLRYARPTPPSRRRVSAEFLIENTLTLLNADPLLQKVDVVFKTEDAELWCDPDRVIESLTNIVLNSAEAMNGAGRIRIDGSGADDRFMIRIRDNGPGIPDAIRERVFEPFFSNRPNGTGLGLAIARQVIRANDGEIDLETHPDGGAVFVLHLPFAT